MNIYINKYQLYKYIYDYIYIYTHILACFSKGASFCKQVTGTFCSFALERSRSDFPTKKIITPGTNINFEKILPGGFI